MQFTLTTLMALAASISLTTAAPTGGAAASSQLTARQSPSVLFCGADAPSCFSVPFVSNQQTYTNNGLSISSFSFDSAHFACTFTGQFSGDGLPDQPAVVADVNNPGNFFWGPPQPVISFVCNGV